MFIEVDVWGVAPRQGCNVLLCLEELASLNELAQSGSTTLHPWRGAGPKITSLSINIPTPDGVDAGDFFSHLLDSWDDHFRVDIETGAILAATSADRATASCLKMNCETQLAARLQWMRLGPFP